MSRPVVPAPGPAAPAAVPGGGTAARRPGAVRAVVCVVVVLAVVVLRTWVVGTRTVEGASMGATLPDGQVVVVDELGPRLAGVGPGDVVVLRAPGGEEVVKRVVAVGGQVVEITGGELAVDGVVVDEPGVDHEAMDGVLLGPLRVPAGSAYVLGDDRRSSVDSRDFGPVPSSAVEGRVLWPPTGPWDVLSAPEG